MWQLYLEASLSSAAEALGEKDSFVLTKINVAALAIGKPVFLFTHQHLIPPSRGCRFLGDPFDTWVDISVERKRGQIFHRGG